jgi:AraC-like DNA-binding protein
MELATELLLSEAYNVAEAAFAVGYSSLGNFSKSFCEEIGCCPVLFPPPTALVADFAGGQLVSSLRSSMAFVAIETAGATVSDGCEATHSSLPYCF